jgi:hypothetical protein
MTFGAPNLAPKVISSYHVHLISSMGHQHVPEMGSDAYMEHMCSGKGRESICPFVWQAVSNILDREVAAGGV